MDLHVNLPADMERQLEQAATSEGVSSNEFVVRTLKAALKKNGHRGALDLLREWGEQDKTSDPSEIAKRRKAWESFKDGMNTNHSSGRKVYP
jgi:hypothetical protein